MKLRCLQCELEMMLGAIEVLDFEDKRLACRAVAGVFAAVVRSQCYGERVVAVLGLLREHMCQYFLTE